MVARRSGLLELADRLEVTRRCHGMPGGRPLGWQLEVVLVADGGRLERWGGAG